MLIVGKSPAGSKQRHDANPLPAQHAPHGGHDTADPVAEGQGTWQLTRLDWSEAPPCEALHEPAIDQRVDRRPFVSEQGIDHLRRNPLPTHIRSNDQRCQLGGAIGVAT